MKKVKVTQEQSEAIERIKKDIDGGITMANINNQLRGGWFSSPYTSLNKLDIKEFLDAIYIGYEVELDIYIGDYVVNENGTIGIVKEITSGGNFLKGQWLTGAQVSMECPSSYIERLATDEEIIFAKKGREVWELRERDILSHKITGAIHEIKNHINNVTYFKSQVSGLNLDATKIHYLVACFAEDRQDV